MLIAIKLREIRNVNPRIRNSLQNFRVYSPVLHKIRFTSAATSLPDILWAP